MRKKATMCYLSESEEAKMPHLVLVIRDKFLMWLLQGGGVPEFWLFCFNVFMYVCFCKHAFMYMFP